MSAPRAMTVRYRVLAVPGRGSVADNVVEVGLDVAYENQFAPVVFEGAPAAVRTIRAAMDGVPLVGGDQFDLDKPNNACALAIVMRSRSLAPHTPALIEGAEIFGRRKPIDRSVADVTRLAELLAKVFAYDLDTPWDLIDAPDAPPGAQVQYPMAVWRAWREVKSPDEIASELERALPAALEDWIPANRNDGIVAWPRDADRVPAIARIVAEVFEEHSEPRALFEALQARLR